MIDKDKDILKDFKNSIDDAEKIVCDFIEKQPMAKHYMFVAAPFGIGKSYFIKKISSQYATRYLDSTSDYIPIVVFLRDGLENVYYEESLSEVLDNIIPPDNNGDRIDTKILLMFDGIEEYQKGSLESLKNDIISKIKNYPNRKVIVTARLKAGLPDALSFIENYLRLLPFTPEQINEFFEHYKVKLTYDQAINQLGLNEDEITKPLLAWMLSQIPKINDDIERLKSNKKLTSAMTKSLIYLYFLHHIISGQYVDPCKGEDKNRIRCEYLYEKKTLRKIALLKQTQRESKLTLKDVTDSLSDHSIDLPALQKLLISYFYTQDGKEIVVDFVHQTFKEYLLSEYYFESLLKGNKIDRMNIGIPSEETVEFLKGLIELLNTNDDDRVKEFVEYAEENVTLLNSFEYKKGLASAKQQIIDNALEYIEGEGSNTSSNTYDLIRQNELNSSDYTSGWINKWISLYVLNILIPMQYSSLIGDKRKLINLLRFTSKEIPSYLKKLKGIDLSNADLLGADFSEADMSAARLRNTKFGCTNLSNADLTNADLVGANLSEADLSNADLSNADLSNADLSEVLLLNATLNNTQLREANLSNAKLSKSNLTNVNLSSANLWRANLSEADLSEADLTSALLPHADMSSATLSDANLSNANLSDTILINAKLSRSNLSSTCAHSCQSIEG